ncbi:MAG: TetR/AcrR family transcriptional regulator [Solirubrobacteraceae bacterium]
MGLAANGPPPARFPAAGGDGAPGRERVAEIQRARIVTAMVELVCERGVSAITVADIVGRSGVSRRTFYDLFSDRDDCLLAAFEHAVARAAAVVVPAYEGAGSAWRDRIGAGLEALLKFLDEEPALGRLCVVDVLAAERPALEHRARVVEALVDAVHEGGARPRGGARRRPARIVAEGAAGAVLAVIHARLCEPSPGPLSGLLNELMGMVVLPYLGAAAAARELERPVPKTRRRLPAPADPLRELDMRLTYRTMRVLLAISELGGRASTNREVADASGISDQGQMSKLLWRLEHLGLIANAAVDPGRGEPNAWALTPRGQQVERAIRAQTGR